MPRPRPRGAFPLGRYSWARLHSSSEAAASVGNLNQPFWDERFADKSQLLGNRKNKASSAIADFKRKEEFWADGYYNSTWIKDMLKDQIYNLGRAQNALPTLHHMQNTPKILELHIDDDVQMRSADDILTHIAEEPSLSNFLCILHKCRKKKDLKHAKCAHEQINNTGMEVGNHVVPMFVQCGSVSDAQEAFDRSLHPNEHSWTYLILGYIECGQPKLALDLYEKMLRDGTSPSSHTITALLRACGSVKDIENGQKIHEQIKKKGFERDTYVGNGLVDMYAKCGSLVNAREVFDNLPVKDVVSWNSLIAGYVENGLGLDAINYFEQMQLKGTHADAITYVCSLKACGSIGAIDKGREIHAEIFQKALDSNPFVGNTLVGMYAKCSSLLEAQDVFDRLPVRHVVSWTAIVAGYAEIGSGKEALKCFEQMQAEGLCPDVVTFCCTLKACGSIGALDKGRELHKSIARRGLEKDISISNSLIDMYAKCGSLTDARNVFDKMAVRDVISWTSIIAAYAETGLSQEALNCFGRMRSQGVSPNAVTFVCTLKACANLGTLDRGREIHTEMSRKGFEGDPFLGNVLAMMYIKCGSLPEAQEVFDKLPDRDLVLWNAFIAGYVEAGLDQKALGCIEQMPLEGVSPNAITYVCGLKACSNLGAIERGRKMHFEVTQKGLEGDLFVNSSLVDMYAKCGFVAEARDAFDKLPIQDAISYSAIIRGYGMNHDGNMAVQCFENMQSQGVTPDAVTFLSLLTACSRASLMVQGQQYFNMMRKKYGISPTIDHYNCMIDLLGRSGHLHEAVRLLENAETLPSKETWIALLSACKTYTEVDLGLSCFQRVIKINAEHSASYVLMASIYATAGRRDDANRIEELRKAAGAMKKPARALIEINKKVHEFVVGDNENAEVMAMLETLNSRMKKEGYVPNVELVLRPLSDNEKETALCGHAEKLAIAFGLLHTPQGHTLRVTKSLRMCNDCHNAGKIISKIERREIVLRESSWVHHFNDGLCSCGDMW